jgi:hypothetical protein
LDSNGLAGAWWTLLIGVLSFHFLTKDADAKTDIPVKH